MRMIFAAGAAVTLAAVPALATIPVPVRVISFTPAAQGTPAGLFGIGLNGFVDETREPALGADLFVQLDSVANSGRQWNFTARISNTSDTGLLSSARLSAFGFSTAQTPTSLFFQPLSSVNFNSNIFGVAAATNAVVGLPFPEFARGPQLCFKAGGAINNCAGAGGGGLAAGAPTHTITFALNFANEVTSLNLFNFVARYQSISGSGANGALYDGDSGVGYADVVPEPASWAMLIAGFGLVGAAMRRRQTAIA
jgi:hypothetical protein